MIRWIARPRYALVFLALVATFLVAREARPLDSSPVQTHDCLVKPVVFHRANVYGGAGVIDYSPPPGREFVVTDFTVANIVDFDRLEIQLLALDTVTGLGDPRTSKLVAPPHETMHLTYTTGPTFREGEKIWFPITYASADFRIAGYEAPARRCGTITPP
ncbi:MAG: hypothetical protein AAF628_37145 [Planctomycetota bacterium]